MRPKPVYCVTNGVTYASVRDAARCLNMKPMQISHHLSHSSKLENGMEFTFVGGIPPADFQKIKDEALEQKTKVTPMTPLKMVNETLKQQLVRIKAKSDRTDLDLEDIRKLDLIMGIIHNSKKLKMEILKTTNVLLGKVTDEDLKKLTGVKNE